MKQINLKSSAIKPGAKAVSSIPTLTATSTLNRFQLNSKAMEVLGLKVGDFVYLADECANKTETREVDEDGAPVMLALEDRIAIFKAVEGAGAKVGEDGSFSYAGPWSGIQLNDGLTISCEPETLVEAGICIKSKGVLTKNVGTDKEKVVEIVNYTSTKKYIFVLEHLQDTDGAELNEAFAGMTLHVFASSNVKSEEVVSRVKAKNLID